jgi:hypothetical protein
MRLAPGNLASTAKVPALEKEGIGLSHEEPRVARPATVRGFLLSL